MKKEKKMIKRFIVVIVIIAALVGCEPSSECTGREKECLQRNIDLWEAIEDVMDNQERIIIIIEKVMKEKEKEE